MSAKHKKEVEELMALAESYGFEFSRYTGSGHYLMKIPGGPSVTLSASPSHPRTYKNGKSLIRRLGEQHKESLGRVQAQSDQQVQ